MSNITDTEVDAAAAAIRLLGNETLVGDYATHVARVALAAARQARPQNAQDDESSYRQMWEQNCAATAAATNRALAAEEKLAALKNTYDAQLGTLLRDLADAVIQYQRAHDLHGDGSIDAGRAWDKLGQAVARARAAARDSQLAINCKPIDGQNAQISTEQSEDKIARYLCKAFHCPLDYCKECHPGSRAYHHAAKLIEMIRKPPASDNAQQRTAEEIEDEVARLICKAFCCRLDYCKQCHPGCRLYHHAMQVIELVQKPPE